MDVPVQNALRTALLLALLLPAGPAWGGTGPVTIVAIGDSLTAGTQDAATLAPTQEAGWLGAVAREIARVRPVRYALPLLTAAGRRIDPAQPPTNVAIPGLELREAFEESGAISIIEGVPVEIPAFLAPFREGTTPVEAFRTILRERGNAGEERWAFIWLGANDAFFDVTAVGEIALPDLDRLTTAPEAFAARFAELLAIAAEEYPDRLFVLTLPDITQAGAFFTREDLEFYRGGPLDENLLQPDDLVPLTSLVEFLLRAKRGEPSAEPLAGLAPEEILSAAEQKLIRARVDAYNAAIRTAAKRFGAVVIEMATLFDEAFRTGIALDDGRTLTRSWGRGGLFSLDGIHPSHAGHAAIADAVLREINAALGTTFPSLDLTQIAAADPYRDADGDGFVAGPAWNPDGNSVAALLRMFVDEADE